LASGCFFRFDFKQVRKCQPKSLTGFSGAELPTIETNSSWLRIRVLVFDITPENDRFRASIRIFIKNSIIGPELRAQRQSQQK